MQEATTTNAFVPSDTSTRPLTIGYEPSQPSGYYLNGYLYDMRITKNVARYTSNFSVPTAPY